MRESLSASLNRPNRELLYARGSIVICTACAMPIYRLARSVCVGTGAGRAARWFQPVRVGDLETLAGRDDLDAGLRAVLRQMGPHGWAEIANRIDRPRAGDPMRCPLCATCFAQVRSVERSEALDQAYVIELVVMPPVGGPARLGATRHLVTMPTGAIEVLQ